MPAKAQCYQKNLCQQQLHIWSNKILKIIVIFFYLVSSTSKCKKKFFKFFFFVFSIAAHVELLGFEHSRGCTTICVRIIQCWEPKNNVCSPPNTLLTIPTCEHCPRAAITAPSDDRQEYLVAGIHRKVAGKKRMLLPGNSKKLALFVAWSDAYLNFLPAEWQPDYESPPW